MAKINLFWFRRDLRLEDNAGLFHALSAGAPVLPIFIFDVQILSQLEDDNDPRVSFIYEKLQQIHRQLEEMGSGMRVLHGNPVDVWQSLLSGYDIDAVYANRDYEPYARERDGRVGELLAANGVAFRTFKDHVIQEAGEVLKKDGKPYTVFTPYSRTWKGNLNSKHLEPFPCQEHYRHFLRAPGGSFPGLDTIGFRPADLAFPADTVRQGLIRTYDQTRNFPAIEGTSRLGIHFRFGTISIREKARKAAELNETFLNELIWRDFYSMILAHFPQVVNQAFRPKYDRIRWRNDQEEFRLWCEGKTGYPIVDAGMRELNATGYMHNRVRMITASFLTKHLLIDWRWGEAYFARKLLDFDLASNNGGWQWAAGCGTDAAPYFRIFNPTAQQQKFDKELVYVRKWVKEYGTSAYPAPIVDHKMARERCLKTYKEALDQAVAS